jgi:hypothetical protein
MIISDWTTHVAWECMTIIKNRHRYELAYVFLKQEGDYTCKHADEYAAMVKESLHGAAWAKRP